jgi:hypothetical protein
MIFDFFEGAAGTGKTHNLVERAAELVRGGVLGDGYRLLALTFMNGRGADLMRAWTRTPFSAGGLIARRSMCSLASFLRDVGA